MSFQLIVHAAVKITQRYYRIYLFASSLSSSKKEHKLGAKTFPSKLTTSSYWPTKSTERRQDENTRILSCYRKLVKKDWKNTLLLLPDYATDVQPELVCCLLERHKHQISISKNKVADVLHNIIALKEDYSGLTDKRLVILKVIFSVCLQIWRVLQTPLPAPFKKRSSPPRLMSPPSKGTSWGGDSISNSLMT